MSLSNIKSAKTIGLLLMIGGIFLFVPYTLLTLTFDYPNILRAETGTILTRFHAGGNALIWTWWTFAMVGLPLLPAYILLGQQLESKLVFVRWATFFGVAGLVVQMLGLLRWTFVVPILADRYIHGSAMTQEAAVMAFQVMHQYAGVILGEHIGQLFTIIWTVMLCYAFGQLQLMPKWLVILGYIASFIYILAQTELFATVMPGVPVLDLAGFVGSTLWLIWLILVGFKFQSYKMECN